MPAIAAPRSGRYVELSASLASQLPQITLCESRACPRWLHRGPAGMPSCLHRWQASSHRYRGATPRHPLWEPGLPAMAAPQSGRYAELSASLASQLLQVPGSHTIPPFVRARLARDGCAAVRQVCRVVCIAGKPAPTGTGEPHHSTLCGSRACPRWLHRGPAGMPSCLHRWQASSHRSRGAAPTTPATADPVGWCSPDSSTPGACPRLDSPARWQPVACPCPNAD